MTTDLEMMQLREKVLAASPTPKAAPAQRCYNCNGQTLVFGSTGEVFTCPTCDGYGTIGGPQMRFAF